MSAVPGSQLVSAEDTQRLVAKTAIDRGDGGFIVRVSRRRAGGMGAGVSVGILSGATAEQIASPEPWIQQLFGGGTYSIAVSHASEHNIRIGSPISVTLFGEEKPFDWETKRSPEYAGPPEVIHPPAPTTPKAGQPGYNGPGANGIPWGPAGQPFGNYGTGMGPAPIQGMPPDLERYRREAEERAQQATAKERELIFQQQLRDQEARQQERERQQRSEMEAKLRAIEDANKRAAESGTKTMEMIAALTASAAPIVTAILQSNAETRREQLRIQEESNRRSAEQAQRQIEIQTKAAEAQQAFMMKMMERPTGPDPAVLTMVEILKANASSNAEMMSRTVEAMGVVGKTSMGMIEAVAEISMGQQESPVIQGVREAVKAVAALASGAQRGAMSSVRAQQAAVQQQGQGQGQGQGRPMAPPPPLPLIPGQALQPSQPGQQSGQPQPMAIPFPEAQPAPAPAPAQSSQPENFAGLLINQQRLVVEPHPQSQAPQMTQAQPQSIIAYLKAMIEHYQDPKTVAEVFISNFRGEEIQAALTAYDGNVEDWLRAELGLWAIGEGEKATVYLTKVQDELDRLAGEAGLLESDDEEDEEVAF